MSDTLERSDEFYAVLKEGEDAIVSEAAVTYNPKGNHKIRVYDVAYRKDQDGSWAARIYQPEGSGPFPAVLESMAARGLGGAIPTPVDGLSSHGLRAMSCELCGARPLALAEAAGGLHHHRPPAPASTFSPPWYSPPGGSPAVAAPAR
jgi:hypothetical protein